MCWLHAHLPKGANDKYQYEQEISCPAQKRGFHIVPLNKDCCALKKRPVWTFPLWPETQKN
jgi:hypothetical protein